MSQRHSILIIIGAVILIAAWGAFFYADHHPDADAASSVLVSGESAATTTDAVPGSGVKTYVSSALGISFRYDASQAGVNEQGNAIYVYPLGAPPGQQVERFEKLPGESFEQSIRRQILAGAATGTCSVDITESNKYQGGYEVAEITYPAPSDPADPLWQNASECNATYDKANGIRFFLYDINHPDRFYFFDIGTYVIPASPDEPWQDTVTIQ